MMAKSRTFRSERQRNVELQEIRIFLSAILLIPCLLCSCGRTVKDLVHNPDFALRNHPKRTLNVMIVTEEEPDTRELTQWLETCGRTIDEQVGITLKPAQFVQAKNLPSVNDISGRLTALHSAGEGRDDWDIMINPAGYGTLDIALCLMNLFLPVPMYQGYIDDAYRKIIVLKSRDCRTFVHELFHAFILSHNHSNGVMAGMTFQLLPFTPPLNNTLYLNEKDRDEVLKNKWRDFRTKSQLSLETQRDLIRKE